MFFLYQLDKLSYKKILSIGLFLAMLFAVPTTVLLMRQRTRLASRAVYVKPSPASMDGGLPAAGPVPQKPAEIGRLFPFLGKIGDIVFIQGKNFGRNPAVKSLKFNGILVSDNDIAVWEDELIQFRVPPRAVSGTVELAIGDHPVVVSYPFTVYDYNTKLKLKKKGNLIVGVSAEAVDRVRAWLGDDTHVIPIEGVVPVQAGERSVLDTGGEEVLSIVLYNKAGQILPFYVDPIEFRF